MRQHALWLYLLIGCTVSLLNLISDVRPDGTVDEDWEPPSTGTVLVTMLLWPLVLWWMAKGDDDG